MLVSPMFLIFGVLFLLLMAILLVSICYRMPYYFLSYVTQKKSGPPVYQVAVWKGRNPLRWQVEMNNLGREVRYRLLAFQKISKKNHDEYLELTKKS